MGHGDPWAMQKDSLYEYSSPSHPSKTLWQTVQSAKGIRVGGLSRIGAAAGCNIYRVHGSGLARLLSGSTKVHDNVLDVGSSQLNSATITHFLGKICSAQCISCSLADDTTHSSSTPFATRLFAKDQLAASFGQRTPLFLWTGPHLIHLIQKVILHFWARTSKSFLYPASQFQQRFI